jgi:hypothetical protein
MGVGKRQQQSYLTATYVRLFRSLQIQRGGQRPLSDVRSDSGWNCSASEIKSTDEIDRSNQMQTVQAPTIFFDFSNTN